MKFNWDTMQYDTQQKLAECKCCGSTFTHTSTPGYTSRPRNCSKCRMRCVPGILCKETKVATSRRRS